ncbi:MAG: outer membrane lipoprotein-sorting protein [bacterium]
MRTIAAVWILSVVFLMTAGAVAQSVSPDVEALIREIDDLYRSSSSYSEMEMEVITPHWQRTLSMKVWTEGLDHTLVRILSPKKEQGVGTLRVANEMWNYLPKTNKVIKVPPSMMMSSWMGSDFTNDDLVKEFSLFEDYSHELIRPDSARDDLLYVRSVPRPDLPIVWGSIVTAVRSGDHIPLWQKYYDEHGQTMRVLQYSDVKQFGERRIPAVMEMVPLNKEGHKTIVRYSLIEFDAELESDIFSLRNLQSP